MNGVKEGISKEYYKSGKLKAEGYVVDEKWEGICKEYYESGQLTALRFFID